jgi:hypothetical protein
MTVVNSFHDFISLLRFDKQILDATNPCSSLVAFVP